MAVASIRLYAQDGWQRLSTGEISAANLANATPCKALHPSPGEYLDACIKAVGITDNRKGRCSAPRLARPAANGQGSRTFRATGITDHLTNDAYFEVK